MGNLKNHFGITHPLACVPGGSTVEENMNQARVFVASLTSRHNLLEHLELAGCVKGHKVHAAVPAEITSVEPVPVLQGQVHF